MKTYHLRYVLEQSLTAGKNVRVRAKNLTEAKRILDDAYSSLNDSPAGSFIQPPEILDRLEILDPDNLEDTQFGITVLDPHDDTNYLLHWSDADNLSNVLGNLVLKALSDDPEARLTGQSLTNLRDSLLARIDENAEKQKLAEKGDDSSST